MLVADSVKTNSLVCSVNGAYRDGESAINDQDKEAKVGSLALTGKANVREFQLTFMLRQNMSMVRLEASR